MKGLKKNEITNAVVKEYGSSMDNEGHLPDSALPADAKEAFAKQLGAGKIYKVDEKKTVTFDDDNLGDVLGQVTNLF